MIFSIIKDSNVLEELLIEHFLELERNVEINSRNGFIDPTLNWFPTQPSNQTQPKIWVNESFKHFLGGVHVKYHWNGSKSSQGYYRFISFWMNFYGVFIYFFDVTQINMCKYIVLNLKVSSRPTYILKNFLESLEIDALTLRLSFGHINIT